MRGFGLAILACCFLAATGSFSQEATGDKEKIQGTWKVVSQQGFDNAKVARVVIAADKLTIELAAGKLKVAYKLDASKKPKAFDIEGDAVDPKNPKDRKFAPGIYLLEGDDLKLCWDGNRKSRPTEFANDGKGERDLRLLVLKREKKK